MSGLFNINEPVTFGYPIVGNKIMIIPFILVPIIGSLISYYAISYGYMSACVCNAIWTTPPLIYAFLSTLGDYRAVLIQLLVIAIGTIVFAIFMKLEEQSKK